LVGAGGQLSAAASHARPGWSFGGSLVAAEGQLSATGAHGAPGVSLSAPLAGSPGQLGAGASHVRPGWSVSASLASASGQLGAGASQTRPGWSIGAGLVASAGQLGAAASHIAPAVSLSATLAGPLPGLSAAGSATAPSPVQPGSGAPVVAFLSLARLLGFECRLAPLLTLTMEMDGKPMTTTLRPIAGEEMELRLRVRTPAGGLVAAGGIAITAKPPGGAAVRSYTAVAAGPGDFTATVLFDLPGRWWISGACETPSRAIAEFPVEVQPRAVS
jgi:hypothetical protein